MSDWKRDLKRANQFLPHVKRLLGLHLIGEASIEMDQKQAVDLIVLGIGSHKIGVRMRDIKRYRHGPNFLRYLQEFTIRCDRPSGTSTELEKILNGFGDYIFYGWGWFERGDGVVRAYYLIDLTVFRATYKAQPRFNNHDRSSAFVACRVADFPASLIIAQGGFDYLRRVFKGTIREATPEPVVASDGQSWMWVE